MDLGTGGGLTFNESAIIKYGATTVSLSRGRPACVEFNWMKLFEVKLSLGKDFDPDKVSFYHVHPPGFDTYSALDVECVKGFNAALGYPVYFAIILFNDSILGSVRHTLLSYRFMDDRMKTVDPLSAEPPGKTGALTAWDLVSLKACSYAEEVS